MNDFWYGYIAIASVVITISVILIIVASWGPTYDCTGRGSLVFEKIQQCEEDPNTKTYDCEKLIKSIYCEEKE